MTKLAGSPVLLLDPATVRPHPQNPRVNIENDPETDKLQALISAQGQKVPALVRTLRSGPHAGEREVILGHRRRVVASRLLLPLHAIDEALDDETALGIMLAEHHSHLAPNPFLESEAVANLHGRPGWDLQRVADFMGQSKRWVAHRVALRKLTHAMRKLLDETDPEFSIASWPVDRLAEIAGLEPDVQDSLAQSINDGGYYRFEDERDYQRFMAGQLNLLGKAPWKLEDAELVPAAGACSSCPKTSLRSPGLFDDGDEDLKDVRKAKCLDLGCWRGKINAQVSRQVAEAKAKSGSDVVLLRGDGGTRDDVSEEMKPALRESWEFTPAKKSDKGAVPAIVVNGRDAGKKSYVVPRPGMSSGGSGPSKPKKAAKTKEPTPAERLKDSRERIGGRRDAFFVDSIREKVLKLKEAPSHSIVLGLVVAFHVCPAGTRGDVNGASYGGLHGPETTKRKKLYALAAKPDEFDDEIWPRVRTYVAGSITRASFGAHRGNDEADAATWIADLLGFDKAAIEAKALAAIPDPKWWGTQASKGLKASAAASKKVDKAMRAAARSVPKSKGGGKAKVDKAPPVPAAAADAIHALHTGGDLSPEDLAASMPALRHLAVAQNTKLACGSHRVGAYAITELAHVAQVTCQRCLIDRNCRGCGVADLGTDMVVWVEIDLCSSCAGAQPKGKKPPAKSGKAAARA